LGKHVWIFILCKLRKRGRSSFRGSNRYIKQYKKNKAKMAHGMTKTRMIKSKIEIKSKVKVHDENSRWRFKMEIKFEKEIQDGDSK
jgi:hypothetical protein